MWQWNDETKRWTADYMESWLKKEGEGGYMGGMEGSESRTQKKKKEHQINYIKFEMWWNAMFVMWSSQQVYYRTGANISQ
jgi:hypothetical protein